MFYHDDNHNYNTHESPSASLLSQEELKELDGQIEDSQPRQLFNKIYTICRQIIYSIKSVAALTTSSFPSI